MTIRRALFAFLITACLLALVGLAPVSIRAQYSYQDKVLAIDSANLWGYWPLDETSGTNANDLSSNNNDGTYNGTTLASVAAADGAWLDAPAFDGINDSLGVPTLGLANHSFTISAWIRQDANATAGFFVAYTSTSGFEYIWFLTLNTGVLRIRYGASSTALNSASGLIAASTWYHVAAVYNHSTTTTTLYIDGVSVASGITPGTFTGASPNIQWGGHSSGFFTFWNGALDEVAIWGSVLSEDDIEALADTAGLPTPTPTQTSTPTVTPTLEFGQHIILSSGQVGALYYRIDAGSVLLALLLLLQIGLLLALLALRMWRRA